MREDWIECTFEELTISLKRGPFGGDLKKSFFVKSGFPVYEQQHAINNDYSNIRYFIDDERFDKLKACNVGPGDYIVSCSGTMGKISQIPNDAVTGVINQALLRIRLNDEIMLHNYFIHYFRSSTFQKKILKDSRGSGMQNLAGIKELKPISINIPPRVEQKAIVKKIEELFSSLDRGIEDLKRAQDQLKIYRQAVLKKAFEGELTDSIITKRALESYSELITKGASPKWQGFDYTSDKNQLLFITSENVREGYISLEKEKFLPTGFNEVQKRSILKNGDVLLNIVGASIGRAAIFELNKLSNINQAVCLIRLKDNVLLKKYLCYYLNSEAAKQDYLNKQVDVARANLSLTNVKELEIPYCNPSQQHQIVQEIESRLSVCDAVERNIQGSLEKAQALRQSILKKAFEGTLLSEDEIAKCKAYPDYEPASVLLERIKKKK